MSLFTFLYRYLNGMGLVLVLPLVMLGCFFLDNVVNLVPTLLQSFTQIPMIKTFTSNINQLTPYILTLCLMIVLIATIINLKLDAVKHVVHRLIHVSLMSLLIPVIISQGISLASTITTNISALIGNGSVYTTIANTLVYENPEFDKLSASDCQGKSDAWGAITIGDWEVFKGFVKAGDYYNGENNNYIQGVSVPFLQSVDQSKAQFKVNGLNPNDNNSVFPNDNGNPHPDGLSGGPITEDTTPNQLLSRYMYTGCAPTNKEDGVTMKWEALNPLLMFPIAILLIIVAGMILLNIVEKIYESLMLGIVLPLTNIFRVSETGMGIFKSHLTQFGLSLLEIPMTIVTAWMGVSFFTFVLTKINDLAGSLGVDTVGSYLTVINPYIVPVLLLLFLIITVRIISKGPQRLSKVFESNFGTSSTGSQFIGETVKQAVNTGISMAVFGAKMAGGAPGEPGTPDGGAMPDREDGVIQDDNTPDSYANASRSGKSINGTTSESGVGDIDETPSTSDKTSTRNTTIVEDENSVGTSSADSPYSGMSSQERTTQVNNKYQQTSSGQQFNPDDFNGTN